MTILLSAERRALAMGSNGFPVLSQQHSEKLTLKEVNPLSRNAKLGSREVATTLRKAGAEETQESEDASECEVHADADESLVSTNDVQYI